MQKYIKIVSVFLLTLMIFSVFETSFFAVQMPLNNEDSLTAAYNAFESNIMESTGEGLRYGSYPVSLSAIKTSELEYTLNVSFEGEILSFENVFLEIVSYRENKTIISELIPSTSKIELKNIKRFNQYNISVVCPDNEFDTVYLGDFYFIDNQEELLTDIECDLVLSKTKVAKNENLLALTKEYKNLISLGFKHSNDIVTDASGTKKIAFEIDKTAKHSYSKTFFSQIQDAKTTVKIEKLLLKGITGGFANIKFVSDDLKEGNAVMEIYRLNKDNEKISLFTFNINDEIFTLNSFHLKACDYYIDITFTNVPENLTYALNIAFVEYSNEESLGYIQSYNPSAPDYDYALWLSDPNYYFNCYAYALNIFYGSMFSVNYFTNLTHYLSGSCPSYQVGSFDGTCQCIYPAVNTIFAGMFADARVDDGNTLTGKIYCKQISRFTTPSIGTYKIYLYTSSEGNPYDISYHFYRQDSNGNWSHKVPEDYCRITTANGVPVDAYDFPSTDFDIFEGCFEVKKSY